MWNGKSCQKWFYNRLSEYTQHRHENHILGLANSTYKKINWINSFYPFIYLLIAIDDYTLLSNRLGFKTNFYTIYLYKSVYKIKRKQSNNMNMITVYHPHLSKNLISSWYHALAFLTHFAVQQHFSGIQHPRKLYKFKFQRAWNIAWY